MEILHIPAPKRRHRSALTGLVVTAVCLLALVSPGWSATLTPLERQGKQIYLKGVSPSGRPIEAFIGRARTKISARAVPCGNCHGGDGLGRPEGGELPPAITWTELTKPYGHSHPGGRRHSAFDRDSVIAAISTGVDPADNPLDPAMPIYRMSIQDVSALIAYLRRIETDLDPGITDAALRIGTLLPKTGGFAPLGAAIEAVLRAYFAELNRGGGIHGRRIELRVAEFSADADTTRANARRLVDEDEVFALVSPFTAGLERDLSGIFKRVGMPLIGPFTLFAGQRSLWWNEAFFILPGVADQARALVEFSVRARILSKPRVAIVVPPHGPYDDLVGAIKERGRRHGWGEPAVARYSGRPAEAADAVARLHRDGVDAVFYFGPSAGLPGFAAAAAEQSWAPFLFVSGVSAGRHMFDLPKDFSGRLFAAFPRHPFGRGGSTEAALKELRAAHGLANRHLRAQATAYSAAKVLVEALKRTGKALSRASLVAALEALYDFDAGLARPVSFGINRRVGSLGAYVFPVDSANRGLGTGGRWIAVGANRR